MLLDCPACLLQAGSRLHGAVACDIQVIHLQHRRRPGAPPHAGEGAAGGVVTGACGPRKQRPSRGGAVLPRRAHRTSKRLATGSGGAGSRSRAPLRAPPHAPRVGSRLRALGRRRRVWWSSRAGQREHRMCEKMERSEYTVCRTRSYHPATSPVSSKIRPPSLLGMTRSAPSSSTSTCVGEGMTRSAPLSSTSTFVGSVDAARAHRRRRVGGGRNEWWGRL
jgi:hypothetical protein